MNISYLKSLRRSIEKYFYNYNMNFLFFLFCLSLLIFLCSLLFRRFIIGTIRKYLMESYGTNNFTFKYGIHTISIDYLCGHGPDSEIKIISLEIVFDIFGYLFKKLPFLRLRVGKISFELNTKNLGNNSFNNINFFDTMSGDDLTEALKARQRIKYQKQNPQKLRIHHQFDQNQNEINNQDNKQDKINTSSSQEENINQQPQIYNQNQQSNDYIQDSIKSNQNPLERWIARRLFGFFLAILVRSAQIDSGSLTLKVGSLSLNIKDISVFYNRSATSIVSHFHFNEISVTSDKKIPFNSTTINETNDNDTIKENEKDLDNSNNNNDNNLNTNNNDYTTNDTQKDEQTALLRVPDISITITSDTQSFKYFLGGMLSQFRIKIDEVNIDYTDGQMSVSSIQAQMYAQKDSSSKTHVEISQLFVLLPVIELYTKTVSATINDISLSLESGKFVSGPILVTRNEQPFFSSHSMKYRKGKIDFEYLDATISTPLIIDFSLIERFFSAFSEEIANDINRIRNFASSENSISRFNSGDTSNTNLRVNSMSDSTNNSFFSSTDSVNDTTNNINNEESSSLNNSSEMMSGFDDQSEIQNEIEIDIEKYDEKHNQNGDDDDNDESYDESRNEFESAYDLNEDSWAQSSESRSNYKFSVENESIPRSKSNPNSFRKRRKTLQKKKRQTFLVINSPTAILRFALSDNHIMTYNMRQFTYSNYLITTKSFTLDTSFTDSQHSSSSLNEELKNSSSKLAFIDHNGNDDKTNVKNYQQLIHRFCECHHASFNFITPIIAFKCNTGNFFLTNEFAEGSFFQEFLALFRFIHNQTKSEQNISFDEEDQDENNNFNPLTKYVFSFDVHKFGIEMKVNSLVSKIHRSNEAKRLAIEGLQIRQEKAIQMMNANFSNDSNLNASSTFSMDAFEKTSRQMLFDLYKSTISQVHENKDDDLFYVHSKDFHVSFDGPKIQNKKQGIDELKRSVRFIKKKKELFDKVKRRNKVSNFDEKYENYKNEDDLSDEIIDTNYLNDTETEQSQEDVFDNTKDIEFDKDEFEDVVNKIGTFDCGLLNLNASSISVSSPRIGNMMTFKTIKTNGIMMIMKQKPLKNDDLYHFPIHCDQKSIEFLIPRISHRTITAFNIDECLCNEAYIKYTTAMKELQQDFFFGTILFRKHKFSFKRLEFFDNMRLRYRLKLNMNIKSLDIDYNSKYDAYSQYPLFKLQLPNFKAICDDNEMFQLSADNFYLKILNGLQFDYSFLLTMPSPSMKLKFVSYNPIYEDVIHKIRQKTKKKSKGSKIKYNYNRDELLLLKCRCKKNPFFIPIHGCRMNDKSYDPYKLFRTHSFSVHFILDFDNSQNASVNLDYLQPVINAFVAKKSLNSAFVIPPRFSSRHFCPKLSFVDFSINLPGILITMNRNKILSKINGESMALKFNNRSKPSSDQATTSANNNNNNNDNNTNSTSTTNNDNNSNNNNGGGGGGDDAAKKKKKKRKSKVKFSSFSLDIGGKNMRISTTLDERNLFDSQISSMNINYEKGYSVDVNIGTINSEFSPRIINFLAYPPIVKINNTTKSTKSHSKDSTTLPLNLSLQPNSNTNSPQEKSSPNQHQQQDKQQANKNENEESKSSSYFPFAFPKYENRTELPTFDRDDQFQMLFSKRTIIVKIDSCSTTLRFNNNKTMNFKASTIRFEQRIIPKDDEYANNHRQSKMLDFNFNLCPPLQSVSAESLSVTTAKNGQKLLFLESPYFTFSKATNLTYYQIIGSTLTICPSEEDFFFFIPTTKSFIDDLYTLHKERQRQEYEELNPSNNHHQLYSQQQLSKNNKNAALRAVISSSYLKQVVIKLVGNDLSTLGTLTADDLIIQIRRSHELLEIGQFLIRKISCVNELDDKESLFKNVIETKKEPFLTLKYDKPPILMKNSFIQSIRVMINPFKLRIDTSYIKRLNAEFPSASMLRVFILEGSTMNQNGDEVNQSIENFDSNEVDLSKPMPRNKHSNSMSHSSSSHFNSLSGLDSDIVPSNGANYDDKIDQVKKKKKNKTASESDTEMRRSEKKRQKKEKKERKKESKKLAKESLYNRALRLKNPFFCQHFNFAELPIEVSFRSFDDNNSPYLTNSSSNLFANSNSKDNVNSNSLTPTNLILDRNMQIGNLDIVDFYGDYKMLSNDISWHLKSSYFRSLSSLLLKKRKNSTTNPIPQKPDS